LEFPVAATVIPETGSPAAPVTDAISAEPAGGLTMLVSTTGLLTPIEGQVTLLVVWM
jgi:hypothetical protein